MEFLNVYNDLCKDIDSKDKQDFFEGTIQTFFGGSKVQDLTGLVNGKYDIQTLYEKVSESGDDIHINAVDLTESLNIYTEYLDGMIKFINDIKNVNINEGEDLEKYSDKFNLAKKNDFTAIESLFGGSTNEAVDMTLERAVSNVDFLVDLLPSIKSFYGELHQVSEACKDIEEETKSALLSKCIDLMKDSIDHFCESALRNSFSSYESMINAIYHEPITEGVSDENFVLLY